MTNPTNSLRAAQIEAVLERYEPDGSLEENLIDLLADAMHWCHQHRHSFDALLITARMHIEFEKGPDEAAIVKRKRPRSATKLVPHFPIGLRPLGTKLLELSKAVADFMNEQTEVLSFDDYATLCEQETKLLAYANLLGTFNADAFLADELREAEELLSFMRQRTAPV
jgi:hypothetical protein